MDALGWFAVAATFVFGLVIGSFMTVVVARVPAGESVVRPRSRCPSCGEEIRARDNIPLVSWLLLRGRCRACGAAIPLRYPIMELTTALLVVGAVAVGDDVWTTVIVGAFLALMPAIALIDIQHRVIPNRITYPALIAFPVAIVVAAVAGAPVDLVDAALGFLLYGGGLLVVALLSRGMGMGDVKLAALIGVVLGSIGLPSVGVAAAAAIVLGGLGGLVALLGGKGRKSKIPFGPYLAVGAVIAAFWGPAIADWYGSRLGV